MPRESLNVLLVEVEPAADSSVTRSLSETSMTSGENAEISLVRSDPTRCVEHMDARAESAPIDVIVLDDIPPVTARELVDAIRAGSPTTPIFAINSRRFPMRALQGVTISITREELRDGDLYNLALISRRLRGASALKPAPRVHRNHESYRAALKITRGGVWDWDLRDSAVFYAKSWKSLLGYAPQEVGDSPDEWMRRIHPDDLEQHRGLLASVLDGSESVFESEYRILHRDGGYRWVTCRGGYVEDDKGCPHLVGVQRDIHERVQEEAGRRQIEGHRRHVDKMDAITRLAGGIAHDFNNLLVVILGYSDFILSNLDSSHPLHRDLVEIKTAGEQAKELTRQLLSFGGRREAEAEELDLCGLVREGLPLIRRVVGEGVDLLLRTPPTSMTVNADSSQLRQALLHMVVHARDHSPDQAPVELVVDSVDLGEETESLGAVELGRASLKPGSYARIRVSARITAEAADEPDETQYRASRFDPDLPLATPERYGFGLSVVHGIAEQVDGTLQIEQSGDVLSTTIFLPRIHSLHDAGSNGPAFSAQLNSRTIVLVEDNSMVRSLVRHILSDQGYRVLVASSGEEAMHICAEHKSRVDLLLTDVVMPRVGGRELADRLRAMIPGLPVLYMSGYTGDQLSEHGVSEDHAFIPKPFTSEELGRKVREVLNGVEEEDL